MIKRKHIIAYIIFKPIKNYHITYDPIYYDEKQIEYNYWMLTSAQKQFSCALNQELRVQLMDI